MTRPIVFVSDLGLRDEFVGVCVSVIARIAPASRVISLSHAVIRYEASAAEHLAVRAGDPVWIVPAG